MKFEAEHYAVIVVMFIVGLAAYHFGVLNIVMPGEKTVSKRCAKRRALYIANVANVGQQNIGASGTLGAPTALPTTGTWGGDGDDA